MPLGFFNYGIFLGVAIMCGVILLADPAVSPLDKVAVSIAMSLMICGIIDYNQAVLNPPEGSMKNKAP